MDIQFQVKLPNSAWDILPLPILTDEDNYELIINLKLPQFISSFLVSPEDVEPYEPIDEPELLSKARELINSKGTVTMCEEGVGGTYFIRDEDSPLAIFKPCDEEPGAINNPKKLIQEPLLPPGGGSAREVAAYLLDKDHFAGVPETYMFSHVYHPNFSTADVKKGSLQKFEENLCDSSEMGSSKFSVEDIHHIGVLDVRIFNLDRNGENILVRKDEDGKHRLIPIDHTYCLPPVASLEGVFFEWHHWCQAKEPFSEKTVNYVKSIDINEEAQILSSLGISEESIMTMVLSTILLKVAVSSGWTLFDIASFMTRGFPVETPSKFEEVIQSAFQQCQRNDDFSTILDGGVKESEFIELFCAELENEMKNYPLISSRR